MNYFKINCPDHPEATLEGFLLDCGELTWGQRSVRPAVVVCPGGGYAYCNMAEGEPVAVRYASKGFHSFVLTYSVRWDAAGFAPLQELSWAIGYIREHAEEWGVDPNQIAVCGFSAGGHLALSSGLLGENKPNAMVLGYPATSAPAVAGGDFMLKFLTGKREVTAEDAAPFDLPAHVTKEAPPMFLFGTMEDWLTNHQSIPLVQKYVELGLTYELHIFSFGPHGFSLADETSSNGNSRNMDTTLGKWHELSVEWLHRIFGKPEFVYRTGSRMMSIVKEMGL